MTFFKNQKYLLLTILCSIGYFWLFFELFFSDYLDSAPTVCFFKNITGVACPSCGITRGVLAIVKGAYYDAWLWNPLSFVVIIALGILPFWILIDYWQGKQTLLIFWKKTEDVLTKKWVALISILILVTIWVWNIKKGL